MAAPSETSADANHGVRAPIVAELVRFGVAQGVSPLTLLSMVGELSEHEDRVPYARANKVWTALAEDRPHHPHGLLLGAASTTTFEAVVAATRQAPTVRDGLRTMVRLFSAFTTEGTLSLHDDGHGTRLEMRHRQDVEGLGHPVEFSLALLVRLVAGPHGSSVVRQARLQHPPLGARRVYQENFGSDLHFEAETNAIVFRDAALDQPGLRTDPLLASYRRLERSFLPPKLGSAQARIEEALVRATQQGRFDVAATARELGLSPRTLQRHAKVAGVELQAMLRAAREALAIELLEDHALSLRAIAERFDYADERSFSRAFERWTGTTPARWRRRPRTEAEPNH